MAPPAARDPTELTSPPREEKELKARVPPELTIVLRSVDRKLTPCPKTGWLLSRRTDQQSTDHSSVPPKRKHTGRDRWTQICVVGEEEKKKKCQRNSLASF